MIRYTKTQTIDRVGQKIKRLTIHIFKMPEPICVIFGILKHLSCSDVIKHDDDLTDVFRF